MVGAFGDDFQPGGTLASKQRHGAAYVFKLDNPSSLNSNSWNYVEKFQETIANEREDDDWLGYAVSISGSDTEAVAIAGAYSDNKLSNSLSNTSNVNHCAIYFYTTDTPSTQNLWTFQEKKYPESSDVDIKHCGKSVVVHYETKTVLVSGSTDGDGSFGTNKPNGAGIVYSYSLQNISVQPQPQPAPQPAPQPDLQLVLQPTIQPTTQPATQPALQSQQHQNYKKGMCCCCDCDYDCILDKVIDLGSYGKSYKVTSNFKRLPKY